MATWERTHSGFSMSRGLTNNSVTEIWVARDILLPTTDSQLLVNDCPPQLGQPYPDSGIPGAICVSKTLITPARRRVAGAASVSMARVAVRYDSNAVRFGFRWKVRTVNYGSTGRPLIAPVVVKASPQGGWIVREWINLGTRAEVMRTVALRLANINPDTLAYSLVDRLDGLYYWSNAQPGELPIPSVSGDLPPASIPCVFRNFEIRDALNGTYEVRYHFVTTGRVKGVKKERIGSFDDLPALEPLQEWAVLYDAGPNGNPVGVVTAEDRFEAGKPFP